ncbi:MAG: hypothetical protein AAGA70_03650 [Pseudomonadota bacterium]
MTKAWWSVRFFYAATFFFAYAEANVLWNLTNGGAPLQPRWVVAWMPDALTGGTIATTAYLVGASAGLIFMQHRWARILVCITLVQAAGFRYSFGGLNHGYHFWIWVSFCLCFLPDGNLSRLSQSYASRHRYLTAFWLAMALVAVFYSLSGFWKVAAGLEAMIAGNINSFSPTALATIVADKLQQSGDNTLLGPFLLDRPLLGWPAHLWVIYVELLAIVAVFRPSLHQTWGLMLIVFHIGTFLLMGIVFAKHVLLLTLLYLWSPFANPFDLRRVLAVLPLVGWPSRHRLGSSRGLEDSGA